MYTVVTQHLFVDERSNIYLKSVVFQKPKNYREPNIYLKSLVFQKPKNYREPNIYLKSLVFQKPKNYREPKIVRLRAHILRTLRCS